MDVVGVDLAWSGEGTGGTGLCLVRDGRVLDSARVRSDDDILAWARSRVQRPVLFAVDAPLVVVNRTGRRPCERALAHAFGRYWAAPHSANLGRPGFERGPRALRLAHLLGADLDPRAARDSRHSCVLEVYPHPALVCLFGLPRRLPYKARRGRTLAERRQAFACLLELLETLVSADPPLDVPSAPRWPILRERVVSTAVGAELDRLEDEVDAYVCAYVALYHLRHGEPRSRVVGDLETGYVVVPVAGAAPGSPLHEAAGRLTTLTA